MSNSESLFTLAVETPESRWVALSTSLSDRKRPIFARLRRFRDAGTQGSALVEMALTLPIMLMVMTGIFMFSIGFYQKLELAEAVSAGGRFLASARGQNDPCALATTAINNAAPTLNSSNITLTFVLNGVGNSPATAKTCPGAAGAANTNMVVGKNAAVTATYPCVINAFNFHLASCTLTAAVTEIVQ